MPEFFREGNDIKACLFAQISGKYTATSGPPGHTDSTGSDAVNMKLSEERAAKVAKFLTDQSRAQGRSFSRVNDEGMELLMAYHWPGNIRELQNVIERAAILARDQVVPIAPHLVNSGIGGVADSPLRGAAAPAERADQDDTDFTTLAHNEAAYIRRGAGRSSYRCRQACVPCNG